MSGVGISISNEQARFARERCAGLPIEIRVRDCREVNDRFDRMYSVGMFEHVGVRNYRACFETVQRCLAERGLTLLHTIGGNHSTDRTDPWIERYIFPNSMLPSAAQVTRASDACSYSRIGTTSASTTTARRRPGATPSNAPATGCARYGETFRRMRRYYVHASMAAFRSRHAQLWQVVFSRHGLPGGYAALR